MLQPSAVLHVLEHQPDDDAQADKADDVHTLPLVHRQHRPSSSSGLKPGSANRKRGKLRHFRFGKGPITPLRGPQTYARASTLRTVIACHLPPRAVVIPRVFSAPAMSRSVIAPDRCTSRMTGNTFAACRAAIDLIVATATFRASASLSTDKATTHSATQKAYAPIISLDDTKA